MNQVDDPGMGDPTTGRARKSPWQRAFGGGAAAASLLAVAPATLLLIVAETRQGRLVGGVAACGALTLVCLVAMAWRWPTPPRPWAIGAGVWLAAGATLAVALAWSSPGDSPERSIGLISRAFGDRRVPRLSPAKLLPEIDQVKLGVTLATRFVPWMGRARTIREVTMGLYRAIEANPDARGLGPVTHYGGLEAIGLDFRADHYFAYVPEPKPGERLGAVVFLHGNGGNFQVMPWACRELAESRRVIILCPTFGFGFWGEGGVEAVDRAWLDALGRWPIDPARVDLAGLSDGGLGVTRSALAHPDRYRGLIYVSPTMRRDELGSLPFEMGWKGRPILVLQGDRDWSVAKSTVDPAVDLLRRLGCDVDYRVFPGEDHFLFFSRRLELSDAIGGWMARAEDARSSGEKAGER